MKTPPLRDIPAALLDLVACFVLAVYDTLIVGRFHNNDHHYDL